MNLGGKQKTTIRLCIDEGFDTQPVARAIQGLFASVPNGKGEHTPQLGKAGFEATPLEKAQKNFRVRVPTEYFAGGFKIFPEFREIVYFSIKNNYIPTVRTDHWLVPGRRQIQNRQAHESQLHRVLHPRSRIVGSAVLEFRDGSVEIRGRT